MFRSGLRAAMSDTIRCSHCSGTGTIRLVPTLQRTLDLVRRGVSRAAQLAKSEECEHTAMLQRLDRLLRLGLVRKKQISGAEWEWSAKKV
jgi:hypothetical protein